MTTLRNAEPPLFYGAISRGYRIDEHYDKRHPGRDALMVSSKR